MRALATTSPIGRLLTLRRSRNVTSTKPSDGVSLMTDSMLAPSMCRSRGLHGRPSSTSTVSKLPISSTTCSRRRTRLIMRGRTIATHRCSTWQRTRHRSVASSRSNISRSRATSKRRPKVVSRKGHHPRGSRRQSTAKTHLRCLRHAS